MDRKYGVDIKWLAVTCFELKFGNTTIVSDPYVTECTGTNLDYTSIENCDIITLTHAHYDHVTDIPRLSKKFNPIIICGDMTAMPLIKWVNCLASKIYPCCPNLELNFGDVKIKSLFGRHTLQDVCYKEMTERIEKAEVCVNDKLLAELQGVGSIEYRNYIFTTSNGVKVLIWGNDATIDQLNILKAEKPDIALMQRTTKKENHEKLAKFIKEIGCKVVIPHHQDFIGVEDPEIVNGLKSAVKEIAPEVEFITPVHGEWIRL